LLQRCLAHTNDQSAWQELLRIAENACFKALKRLFGNPGVPPEPVTDLLADLFLHLHENEWARLKGFRGTTEPELRKYLYKIALHLVRQNFYKERTAKKREFEDT
jgi:DNA-directed RNA polymerase specialized sigma24 family protein